MRTPTGISSMETSAVCIAGPLAVGLGDVEEDGTTPVVERALGSKIDRIDAVAIRGIQETEYP